MRFLLALAVAVSVCTSASQSSGQLDFLILDQDGNLNSGPVINTTLSALGFVGDYTTDLDPYLGDLTDYCSIWICLGMFPYAGYPWGTHSDWDDSLVSYLVNHGGSIYMEGGDCWYNDPPFNLRSCFGIEEYGSGTSFLGPILGVPGTFTEGLRIGYSGDNFYADCIRSVVPAYAVLVESTEVCTCGVANEQGAYTTLGVSFEFGGCEEWSGDLVELGDRIMTFFGCGVTVPDYDMATLEIMSPDWYAVPGLPTAPEVRFKNVGLNDAVDVGVYVVVSSSGYLSSRTISISSGEKLTQTFDSWTPGSPGMQYTLCAYHSWEMDERPQNDTICGPVTSWDGRCMIHSPWTSNGSAVVADGVIDDAASEWQDATIRDVSDFVGRSGSAEPPGSAYLYVMNDSLNLYIALDALADPSRTEQDAWSLYLEDNFDRSWPDWPDSSEGATTIDVSILPMHWYEPLFSGDTMAIGYQVSLSAQYGDSSGHMQYEYIIPCSRDPARGDSIHPNLLAGPGDTIGFWMTAVDDDAREFYAWWPTSSFLNGRNTSQHGMLVLSDGIVGWREAGSRPRPPGPIVMQNSPNPFHRSTVISYSVPQAISVTLTIYDITGRLVETLVNETQQPGLHQVRWNRKANSSGVYFYSLRAGEFIGTRKIVAVE